VAGAAEVIGPRFNGARLSAGAVQHVTARGGDIEVAQTLEDTQQRHLIRPGGPLGLRMLPDPPGQGPVRVVRRGSRALPAADRGRDAGCE
jgi:hypothetical protein